MLPILEAFLIYYGENSVKLGKRGILKIAYVNPNTKKIKRLKAFRDQYFPDVYRGVTFSALRKGSPRLRSASIVPVINMGAFERTIAFVRR